MSLLPYALYTTISNTTPILDPNISVTLSNQVLNNSTINTNRIFLDGNYLDTTGSGSNAALLINGIPLGGVSTGVSSISANWANFPAISTITYATSAGTGGSIIMCNVSSLVESTGSLTAQVGNITGLTVSTINGAIYPTTAQTSLLNVSGTLSGVSLNPPLILNFTGLSNGVYLVSCLFQSTSDPLSCSAVIRYSGGIAGGGSYHQPVIGGNTNLNNYVSIQSDVSGDANIQIYAYSTTFPNSLVQVGVYRLL